MIDAGSQVVSEECGAQGTVEAVQDWTEQGGVVAALVNFGTLTDPEKHWVDVRTLREEARR